MRLNNARQALLLLLLVLFVLLLLLFLPYFSPPSTGSCPNPRFSAGFILQPTLFLYLLLHFCPSVSPSSPHMHVISQPLSGPASALHFHSPRGFTLFFFDDSFCKPVPFKVHVLFLLFFFYFALLYHLLPSTLACICNTHMQEFI